MIFLSLCLSLFCLLSVSQSLSPSLYVSLCLYVFLNFCVSVFLSFCLSVFLSFCLSVFLCLSLSFSVFLCLSVFMSLCNTNSLICPFSRHDVWMPTGFCLSVFLFLCLFVFLLFRSLCIVIFSMWLKLFFLFNLSAYPTFGCQPVCDEEDDRAGDAGRRAVDGERFSTQICDAGKVRLG